MGAIVCDARYTAALAIIRSLGRAGLKVTAVETVGARGVLGFASRYAWERRRVRNLDDLPEAQVVVPVALSTIGELIAHPRRHRTLLPSPSSFAVALDKRATLEAASAAGVPVPGVGGDRFPVVVKYRAGELLGLSPRDRYAICRTPAERDAALEAMGRRQADPLVQEYLPGPGYGVSCLFAADGALVAAFCHRRLREYPPQGGPSSLAESMIDPDLARLGVRVLRALDWRGLAMVEFRADAAGNPRLLEINPRPWGTLALAVAAGVDFPLLWYRLAAGEHVDTVQGYRAGIRLRYGLKDLLSARAQGVGWTTFLRDAYARPAVDAVFDARDPLPGMLYLWRAWRAR